MESGTRNLLNDTHTFPGPYRVKVIGENSEAFQKRVVEAVENTAGKQSLLDLSVRPSANGEYVGLTLKVQVNDADEVMRVYEALRTVAGVRMVM
jgi:putative lipoic acid-binding regulatory protein